MSCLLTRYSVPVVFFFARARKEGLRESLATRIHLDPTGFPGSGLRMSATPPPLPFPPRPLPPRLPAAGYGRSGKELHVRAGGQPPMDRCVKCGDVPTSAPLITFSWHTPLIFLSIFAGVVLYLILALLLRQSVSFRVGLCQRHASLRRAWSVGAWIGLVAFLGGFFVAAAMESGIPLLVVNLPGLILAIVGSRLATTLRPIVIRDGVGHFTGACPSYLESIPAMPLPAPGRGER